MFRLLAFGTSGIALIVSIDLAFAADLPQPGPVIVQPQVVGARFNTWTGCFLGGNAGIAVATWNASVPPVNLPSKSADGVAYGGQLGCDYQAGNWVIGI